MNVKEQHISISLGRPMVVTKVQSGLYLVDWDINQWVVARQDATNAKPYSRVGWYVMRLGQWKLFGFDAAHEVYPTYKDAIEALRQFCEIPF